MKYYVNFDRVITAIANGDDVDIDGETVSFFDVDVVVRGFASIYCGVVDMFAEDRTKTLDEHMFRVARIIRTLTQTICERTEHGYVGNYRCDNDRYLQVVYNLINCGIAPTPALFNIMLNTGYGMREEYALTVGDRALLLLGRQNDEYYKTVNSEFFEDYNTLHNLSCANELNSALKLKLPTTLTEWLRVYEWSCIECEYVKNHFAEFAEMYEKEVCNNE